MSKRKRQAAEARVHATVARLAHDVAQARRLDWIAWELEQVQAELAKIQATLSSSPVGPKATSKGMPVA